MAEDDMLKSAKTVLAARALSKMAPSFANGLDSRTYSTTALKRWSCLNNERPLPAVPDIKAIHVYDFDNTLFTSPLPNPQLWIGQTVGFLSSYDCFANGGWWHDPAILACTGKGIEVEEPLGWKGWWNEHVVQLVELSMKQKDALTVLLTGRAENGFPDLIKRIVRSRSLEFDLVCLKPEVGPNSQRFSSTMNFKQVFLEDLVFTYKHADEIRVYEDRIKHVKGFRDFFEQLNRSLSTAAQPARKPINSEVIHVAEEAAYLPPIVEAAEVQRMINAHNQAFGTIGGNVTKSPYGRLRIKKTVFFTGYLLSNPDSLRLVKYILTPLLPSGLTDASDIKVMANSILISPRAASKPLLARVGGMGKTVRWRVTDTAVLENRLWAAKVTPLSDNEVIYTETPEPLIILAARKGSRPTDAMKIRHWYPVSQENALVFDATVGEKMVLRVDPEDSAWENSYVNKNSNKRAPRYDMPSEAAAQSHQQHHHHQSTRGARTGPQDSSGSRQHYHHYSKNAAADGSVRHTHYAEEGPRRGGGAQYGFRGRGRGGRGGRGGGRGRGRGGGPPGGYRSLDDYSSNVPAHDGPGDDRAPPAGGDPVMNY